MTGRMSEATQAFAGRTVEKSRKAMEILAAALKGASVWFLAFFPDMTRVGGRANNGDIERSDLELNFTPHDTSIVGVSFAIAAAVTGLYFQNNSSTYAILQVTTASIQFMLVSASITISSSMAGDFLRRVERRGFQIVAKILGKIAVASFILQFSVLMWISLPPNLKWVALICSLTMLLTFITSSILHDPRKEKKPKTSGRRSFVLRRRSFVLRRSSVFGSRGGYLTTTKRAPLGC